MLSMLPAKPNLSFRISQEYHPELSPTGEAVVFDVALQTASGEAITPAEDHGGALDFPIVVDGLAITQTGEVVNGTKNAMRTYLVPLSVLQVLILQL